MRVVIVGASGLIGQELLDLCLGDKTIDDVYILVRKPLEIKHEKLTQTLVNYDSLAENVIPEKVDVLFNCLGTTIKNAGSEEAFTKVDFTYVSKIATLAHKKGVDKLISISSMGADIHSKTLYYRVKGMKEDFLMNDCGIDNVF
ncbi:MAG: NAD-dependent epimerase/dehydratase family protein, partial [Flavobacteriales bacterium]